jgi:hypothetical protein
MMTPLNLGEGKAVVLLRGLFANAGPNWSEVRAFRRDRPAAVSE